MVLPFSPTPLFVCREGIFREVEVFYDIGKCIIKDTGVGAVVEVLEIGVVSTSTHERGHGDTVPSISSSQRERRHPR